MSFRFRLAKSLKLTSLQEDSKKQEVLRCNQRIAFIEGRIQTIRSEIRDLMEREKQNPSFWALFSDRKVSLDISRLQRAQQLLENEREVLKVRKQELNEFIRRRKALESVREKDHAEHRVKERRDEQKRLDDFFNIGKNTH